VPTITTPTKDLTWKVGDPIAYSGSALDGEGNPMDPSNLKWQLIIHHCPSNCHLHYDIYSATGASGTFNAPNHDYPSWLELQLTATDANNHLSTTTSVELHPQTATVKVQTSPAGLNVGFADTLGPSPLSIPWIVGSQTPVVAPTVKQILNNQVYDFVGWSDGGAATHPITVPAAGITLTANYKLKPDLALKRPVTASGTRGAQWPAAGAVDGNPSTRWLSTYKDPSWLQVDLGGRKTIGRVIIHWHWAYGKAYKIQVSNDAKTWATVFTTAKGTGGVSDIAFPQRQARYVRFYGTQRATTYGYSFYSFEVYDS
jgi:hypothetical protein